MRRALKIPSHTTRKKSPFDNNKVETDAARKPVFFLFSFFLVFPNKAETQTRQPAADLTPLAGILFSRITWFVGAPGEYKKPPLPQSDAQRDFEIDYYTSCSSDR